MIKGERSQFVRSNVLKMFLVWFRENDRKGLMLAYTVYY